MRSDVFRVSAASGEHPEAGQPPHLRAVLQEMIDAVLGGGGFAAIAAIAAEYASAPVAVVVPSLGPATPEWELLHRYVGESLGTAADPPPPPGLSREVAIVACGERVGSVLLLGRAVPGATAFLHLAATAALTEIAASSARDETEQRLHGSFLEEVMARNDLDSADVLRRASRLGCDLERGVVGLCAQLEDAVPSHLKATIASECPTAIAQPIEGRLFALLPCDMEDARALAARLQRFVPVGISTHYLDPADAGRALDEAELVLGVAAAGGSSPIEQFGDTTYRLLFRILANHPEEMRILCEETVAPLVRYDEQYETELLGTVSEYLHGQNCNMNATAQAIRTHRHTVSYRLERVRELTGLDPFVSEDRERLGLGLKALRIVDPAVLEPLRRAQPRPTTGR